MPLDWQLNTTVIALQGRNMSAAPPANGQVLTWDGTGLQWGPADTSIPDTVFNFNGAAPNVGGLPTTGQSVGDTYYVTGADQYYFWNGLQWTPLAPPVSTVSFPEAPIDGQIYGRDGQTASWDPVMPLSGGTFTGPITLAGDATGNLQPITLQQMNGALQQVAQFSAQFLGTIDAPVGQVFYTVQSGVTGTALVPANQKPGAFVIAVNAGTIPSGGPAGGTSLNVGDWLYSDGTNWIPINIAGGAITSIVQGNGITVSTVNGVATVSLFVPVAIANGGTGAMTASGALDSLSGTTGTVTGALQRATNGVWSVSPVSGGGPTDATQVATNPTINNWTTVQQALQGLFTGSAPINSPVFTGNPTGPNPAPGDSSQSLATTSWVNTAIASYVAQWALNNGVLTDVTTSGDVTSV